MVEGKKKVGAALRFLASGGHAEQDPDMVAELLRDARELASAVVTDENSSSDTQTMARNLLERLQQDTLP